MRILIDGYNLIRQSGFRSYEQLSLEEGRKALLRCLASYRARKGHLITVVFDGWLGGSPAEERDIEGGVEIIYSRIGEKADEVIKRLVDNGTEEIAVVTSDRAIAVYAARRGKSVFPSATFGELLEREEADPVRTGFADTGKNREDAEEKTRKAKKKGPARRPSRQQRITMAALRKL